ncbi:LemA family protein [Anaerotruncus massiliensis (ex Liu et al. 2021)]|uniref:LemA family protein n=3 Tax=Oscillospiraceae TaxID=216572 RepID=A0A498CUW1_9FIRM|nr:LemA family protein [Anaerotruncus massiliensis (ex Togo et al. 2019)]RLL14872.1 LemA family protein [Anaerotruncus massiliensis (ex Liu et al. 2021)]
MSTGVVVLIAVLAIIVIIGVSLVGGYNGIAAARENVDTQQAAIQTQLQRRADLIPNLVNTVKGLAAQEQSVIDSVTEARAQLAGAQGMGMEELAAANDNLSSALSRLLMVVENYPEIQSSQGYISLMDELAGTENRISVARNDYNDAVKSYNSRIITFPNRLVAGMFGFEKAEYFTAPESAQSAPDVNFDA